MNEAQDNFTSPVSNGVRFPTLQLILEYVQGLEEKSEAMSANSGQARKGLNRPHEHQKAKAYPITVTQLLSGANV